MAEFKLGRIKFVYQGNWASNTSYVVDDVVTVGGKTYICILSNTSSSNFSNDLNNITPYWQLMADGTLWRGTWANNTAYNIGDLAQYGGTIYLCNVAHTSVTSTLTLTATSFTVNAGTATLGYAAQPGTPFVPGQTITLSGFSPTTTTSPSNNINTTFTVLTCTTTQLTFALSGTYSNVTLGTVAGTGALESEINDWTVFGTNINWSNAWATSTRYKVNDLVYYGGYTYVCNTAHVSASTISSGLESNQSYWSTFNAGIFYQGAWTTGTRYKVNDIVTYGADVWICTTYHTSSGSTLDATKFTILVNGFQFVNSWSNATAYKAGDVVTYGGYSYTAIQNNTGQTPSTATTYWQVFTTGFVYQGAWSGSNSYLIGNVVSYGGYTYVAVADNANSSITITATTVSTDPTRPNQITTSSTSNLVANLPIIFSGTTFGNIVSSTTYYVSSVVDATHFTISATAGGPVFALTTATGSATGATQTQPPLSAYWGLLNSGVRWTNNSQTFTSVSGTNISSLGTGASFDVTVNKTIYTVIPHSGSAGSGYVTGDTIKILGTNVGGLSPVNDVTLTVTASGGAITSLVATGVAVTWSTGVTYVLGDVVLFGANNYICIQSHVATTGSRPDNDTTATYWNLFTAGSEPATLTTAGDMFYYGLNGPTRLPIGTNGQILRSTNGYPTWATYGIINNVVYVGPTGTDSPAPGYGLTIDSPWASIRYACQQVENGYLNPNATQLLAKNKQFFLKEVNNYVQYTYTVTVSAASTTVFTAGSTTSLYVGMPISFTGTVGGVTAGTTYYVQAIGSTTTFAISATFGGNALPLTAGSGSMTGTYVYSASKTERDAGIVIDGVIFDVSHGGTLNSTTAANAYFSNGSLISGVNSYDIIPFVASLTYLGTKLFPAILSNTAPSSNYQTLNSISSGNQAKQIIDSTLTAESGSTTLAGNLVAITYNALNAQTSTVIATAIVPDTTIYVKTGTYNEILPISIPRNTAIVGDELRSTVIQPAPAIPNLVNDKPKSILALNHTKALLSNLISNTTITPTTGNTQTQVTTLPAGDQGSQTAVNSVLTNAALIQDMISNGLPQAPAFVLPQPTGYNTSFLSTYGNGVTQIVNNYLFIKAEIAAYLNTNYNTIWTSTAFTTGGYQAETIRDVSFILDGLQYDLTYGGNVQSNINGSSYYSLGYSQVQTAYTQIFNAALTRLKTIIGQIVQGQSVSATSGNSVTQYTTAPYGNSTAASAAQGLIQNILNWIANGYGDTTVYPTVAIALASSQLQTSFNLLQARASEIAADSQAWVKKYYQSSNISTSLTNRDAGYIVQALSYDLVFGSNFNSIAAGRGFNRLNTSAQALLANTNNELSATLGAIQFIANKAKQYAAGGSAIQATATINDVISLINGQATTTLTTATTSTNVLTVSSTSGMYVGQPIQFTGLPANITTTATATTTSTNVITLGATASSLGIVAGQQIYFTGSVFGNIVQNQMYYVLSPSGSTIQVSLTYGGSAVALVTASGTMSVVVNNAGGLWNNNVYWINTIPGTTTLTITSSYASGTAYTITNTKTGMTASAVAGDSSNILTNGSVTYNDTLTTINGAEILRANKNFIAYEAAAYISASYGGGSGAVTTTASTGNLVTTSSAHNFVAGDPVVFSAVTVTTTATSSIASTDGSRPNQIVVGTTTGVVAGMPISFAGTNFGGINLSTTYYVKTVVDSTHITISATYNGTVLTLTTGTGSMTATIGGIFGGLTAGVEYYVLSAGLTPTSFAVTATQGSTTPVTLSPANGVATVNYYYNLTKCIRDTSEYINALIYDLNYPGNYKSLRAATLYNNAVSGSTTSNMFFARNGSGLRNCTMNGLTGTLTAANSYGTKRPTAGAYVSLDPGFGPNDTNVWINSRSHYSQNCTMFGTACTGAKIDSALHSGGNKSMVKNDFTTILSDGIGVWCTGSGSLTELVSVFNYYGYAGYLAELGGRIRATNGNSSYGTYGVIAEGTDTFETPIYANLNNHNAQAYITNVVTDAVNNVLRIEYENAGNGYTNYLPGISGSGYNAAAIGDEFRDSAVFETRLIDNGDGTSTSVGGTSYVAATNTGQNGGVGYFTIANTDQALSTAYVGMRIQLTAGTGVGQYANILTYSNGTKTAQIYKDSFATLTITATTQGTPSTVTVASTATLYTNMPFYVATTVGGLSAGTVYYVQSVASTTTFTVALTSGGAALTTAITTTTSQSVALYAAGWDHVVPGTPITNALDLTSTYIIEPRINYTGPGFVSNARTLPSSTTWQAVTYGAGYFLAVPSTGTGTATSTDGKTWTAGGLLPSSQSWVDAVYGGGQLATATAVVGGLGGTGATFTATLGTGLLSGQVVGITVVTSGLGYTTPPTIVISGTGSGCVAVAQVLNGSVTNVTVTVPGSNYTVAPTVTAVTSTVTSITANTWGRNYFSVPTITISAPFTATLWTASGIATSGTYYYYNNAGVTNYYLATSNGTFTTTGPTFTSGSTTNGTVSLTYSGTLAVATATLSNNGVNAFTITNGGYGYTTTPTVSITDTGANYVVISGASNNTAYQLTGSLGSAWTAGPSTGKTNLYSIAYGNGIYIAVGGASGTPSAVSSTNPGNGGSWIDRSGVITGLSSNYYSAVAYGNGYFVAVQYGGTVTSTTTNGTSWTTGGVLPSSANWVSIAYGNGRFVTIATGSNSVAYSYDKGVTWIASPAGLPSSQSWTKVTYGEGLFVAIASGTTVCATSPDGVTWTVQAMPGSSSNWKGIAFGNTSLTAAGPVPIYAAVSATSGTTAASIQTGATPLGRMKVTAGAIAEVRMIEPGSGFSKGVVTATTSSTNVITVDNTILLSNNQPVIFTGASTGGLAANTYYYVIGSSITASSFQVAATSGSSTPVTLSTATGLTGTFRASPIATVTEPNHVKTASLAVRTNDGAIANPSFSNRGTANTSATASVQGDGYADLYQPSSFIAVSNLYSSPTAGANVVFSTIPNTWYKLVSVTNVLGLAGNYTATFQINPALTVALAPPHNTLITTTLKYSQVRLTGHDFLYIGTGNQTQTNYPNVNPATAIQANQTNSSGGGRVFFTSTDQDGNFNVGNLFGVQQATGTATLNASAFNLSGLQSLQLGSVAVGVGSAVITQFSTDPYFTANSDSIVPTQKAIKSYITSQIGGGASSLNVNTLTAGIIYIAGNTISTTSGASINVKAKMNFTGGIDGAPVALAYFNQK